ncbi:hypothetical protein BDV30DRAFT_240232 [Aspergillus minisclerotigenes]|uniref:Uncharacterized protein n=1 Tax=Aspergillus minisclerotigenes TaxID=656917 RepID=A0A5N6IZH4_9EURO|nr:hypothetical protein BDV30DRAFT_240232 [Aspergillus minisclerotigenes]
MFGQALLSWFSTSKTESSESAQPTWDPNTLTMTQPQSPAAPTTENVVAHQPTPTEDMQLQLRGGVAAAVAASAAIAVVLMGLRVDQMAPVEVLLEVLLVREALVVGKLKGCV